MERPQWEYLVTLAPARENGEDGMGFLQELLNRMGDLGWELVASHEGKLIYKRLRDQGIEA